MMHTLSWWRQSCKKSSAQVWIVLPFGLPLSLDFVCAGVLDQILDVQKLDEYDIEGVYMVYKSLSTDHGVNLEDSYRVLSSNDESTSKGPKQEATFALQSLSNKARIEIIKNYLIAATAKDCSIMLAFCLGNVSCEPPLSKLSFHYTICVADLDFKQLSKICEHHQLDCEIVRCFLSKSWLVISSERHAV